MPADRRLDTMTQAILHELAHRARTAVGVAFDLGYDVGKRSRPLPRCQFFDDSAEHPGIVTQAGGHTLDDGVPVDGVSFYVPVEGGGAVRVHVCAEHLAVLQDRYAGYRDGEGAATNAC